MRALAVGLAIAWSSSQALAQPPRAKQKSQTEDAAKPTSETGKAGKPEATKVGEGKAEKPKGEKEDTTPAGARRLDLTSSRLFARPDGPVAAARGKERRSGLSLGDDQDWKVHAAQAGAMAAGFAALVGLCGGGRCMLPSVFGEPELGVSPDLKFEAPRNIRPGR
jgi:hypothetical protein